MDAIANLLACVFAWEKVPGGRMRALACADQNCMAAISTTAEPSPGLSATLSHLQGQTGEGTSFTALS